jgi:hypothetical protein
MISHSEEIQTIFERPPTWHLRYGISGIFIMTLVILTSCWFISYPDVINAPIVLTTDPPPITMVAGSSGKLKFIRDDETYIKVNEVIGYIEGSYKTEDFLTLASETDKIREELSSPENIRTINLNGDLKLGEIQQGYNQLVSVIKSFTVNDKLNLTEKKINYIQLRVQKYQLLNKQLEEQNSIQKEELLINEKKLDVNSKLFKGQVISELDYDQIRLSYLQIKRQFETSQNEILQNEILLSELRETIVELKSDEARVQSQLYNDITASFRSLQSQIEEMKRKYFLIAPFSGKLSILKFYTNNDFVTIGDKITTIIPDAVHTQGMVTLSAAGSGKVKIGQDVNIKLDNYPFTEYGILSGKITSISSVPYENNFFLHVQLPNPLITSHNRHLKFQQELSGTAEIITDDQNLLTRILNTLVYPFRQRRMMEEKV